MASFYAIMVFLRHGERSVAIPWKDNAKRKRAGLKINF